MYRMFFIAKNNLKKKKSDVLVISSLAALATMLLYFSITVFCNIGNVIDRVYEAHNTADYTYVTPEESLEACRNILTAQKGVEDFEVSPILNNLSLKFRGGTETETEQLPFYVGAIEEERSICKLITDGMAEKKRDSIILPYYLKIANSYQIGDPFYLTIGEREYEFEIMGFAEDPRFTTPLNVGAYIIYITQDYMDEILCSESGLERYKGYECKIKVSGSSRDFAEKVIVILTNETDAKNSVGVSYEGVKEGIPLLSNISMAIVLTFAVLLIMVAMIITRFSIYQFVEENLRNIGILQASGYTSKELIWSSLIEILMIISSGELAGLVLGYGLSGLIGNMESYMIGMKWNQGFDGISAVVSAGSISIITAIITLLASRIYGKISVLEALRRGIHTHNFKKNHLPLEKSRQPLFCVLGEKAIVREKLKSISIFSIVVLLSMVAGISFYIYQNWVADTDGIMQLIGTQIVDVWISGEGLEEIGAKLEDWEEVSKVTYYKMSDITIAGKEKEMTVTCDIWKDVNYLKNEMLLEGRLPKYENEIVVSAKVSERLGIERGDVVYVTGNGERKDYIVSGIDQKVNYLGIKALLNFEGEERLNGATEIMNVGVDMKEGYRFDEVSRKITKAYPEVTVQDGKKLVATVVESIIPAMKAICIILVAITIVVVFLVVMLLVKLKVISEWKNYGLYKAIGYTTGQLIGQTVMSNLPITAAGAFTGGILSVYIANPLCSLFLTVCGIRKCELAISAGGIVITILGITMLSLIVAVLYSLRIRKLEPAKLLVEE